jgi:hypothetical protein
MVQIVIDLVLIVNNLGALIDNKAGSTQTL